MAIAFVGAGGTARDTVRPAPAPVIAIVGATIIPMDRERIIPNQTVLVSNGRIISIGPADSLVLPAGATVIEARGRYLVPGLADMHVHLGPEIGARPGFGDAPLFLANGVTTVLNLRGDSTILGLRERVRNGSLVGPTIYTSGEFVNEPRVNTPDEAEREVRAQAAAGYDVIKFREVVDMKRRAVLTTHGLSRAAYDRLMETSRAIPIPLIGHSPNNLGMEAVLEEGQSLAHAEATLMPSYFWPRQTARFKVQQRVGIGALAGLGAGAVVGWGAVVMLAIRRRRPNPASLVPATFLTTVSLALGLLAARELWKPDWIGHEGRIAVLTAAGVGLAALAVALAWRTVAMRRRPAQRFAGWYSGVGAVLAVVLAGSAVGYWVPLVRRSSEGGLEALGEKVARSGIWITPTMVVARWIDLAGNPEMRYATARSREWWDPMLRSVTERRREGARQMQDFLGRVVGALHRAGVSLLAGTDASGWAFMMPGFAIHDELGLLAAGGLSPYDVLRTATVEPARFLQMPDEFGTIAAARRADLVLVEKNPLEDLSTLRKPLGVMVRGRWLPAPELEAMVARLAPGPR